MNAVWTRARAELLRHMAATLWLMLFLGVAGGVVLGALAGARRTDTAYPRMRETTNAGDVLVSVERTGARGFYDELARLPGVEDAGVAFGVELRVDTSTLPEKAQTEDVEFLLGLAPVDDRLLYSVGGPVITAGRLPRPDEPDEAFANRFVAELGVGAGTVLNVQILSGDDLTPLGESKRITIVGTGVFTNEVVPIAINDTFPTLALTPAFFTTYLAPTAETQPGVLAFDGSFVRLESGADVTAFRRATEGLAAKHEESIGGFLFLSENDRTSVIQRAVRPQVVALQLFALLTALTALLLVGQAVARQLYGDASDYSTLRALGMTRRQLFTVGMIRTALIGIGGAAVAAAVAIVTSPFMPLGPARLAEPDAGVRFDVAVLSAGSACIVGALLLVVAFPAFRHARGRPVSSATEEAVAGKPSPLTRFLARVGAPTSMAAGVRMAADPGRGATSTPVRSATLGTILAIAALAATVTFGSSLDRLIDTPRLYGETWDLTVDASFGAIPATPTVDRLKGSPDVEASSAGVYGEVAIDGVIATAIGIDPIEGTVFPTLLEGRPPQNSREIALGTRTLRRIGRRVGDTVELRIEDQGRSAQVVGRVVFPQFGLGSFTPTGLGEGALTTVDALPPPGFGEGPGAGYSFFLVRVKDGAPPGTDDRVRDLILESIPECGEECAQLSRTRRPGDVVNFTRVRSTPLVLASILALLAAAAIVHALVSSVRRRRRDLAIFKTVGFLRRQVSATVAWQATTMMIISLVVGIPAGVAAGRTVWNGFADRLGVPSEPIVPMVVILLGVLGALVVANIAAAWPGARAARLSPAVVLRNE